MEVINKLERGIDNLQLVKMINEFWIQIPRTQAPNKEFLTANNKWYFYGEKRNGQYLLTKFYFDNNFIKNQNTWWQHLKNDSDFIWNYNLVYRWDGNGEPELPVVFNFVENSWYL